MTSTVKTFERRIEMLFLLSKCKKTTVTELSFYIKVSKDTVFRDIAFLSRYAPIYTKQGMYKAWYCGHWHINKRIDKMHFLFHGFETNQDLEIYG